MPTSHLRRRLVMVVMMMWCRPLGEHNVMRERRARPESQLQVGMSVTLVTEKGDKPHCALALCMPANAASNIPKVDRGRLDSIQVVDLACGMDSRAYRLTFPRNTLFWEIDRQEVRPSVRLSGRGGEEGCLLASCRWLALTEEACVRSLCLGLTDGALANSYCGRCWHSRTGGSQSWRCRPSRRAPAVSA